MSDPDCGPQFAPPTDPAEMWHAPDGTTGGKCFRPDAPRYATQSWMVDACEHDGDCQLGGCGNSVCLSYERGWFPCDVNDVRIDLAPHAPRVLPLRWCGCVEGRCSMFTQ